MNRKELARYLRGSVDVWRDKIEFDYGFATGEMCDDMDMEQRIVVANEIKSRGDFVTACLVVECFVEQLLNDLEAK